MKMPSNVCRRNSAFVRPPQLADETIHMKLGEEWRNWGGSGVTGVSGVTRISGVTSVSA